jgi:hypothetical protein
MGLLFPLYPPVNPGMLGTMAYQNANAVAITGGSIKIAGVGGDSNVHIVSNLAGTFAGVGFFADAAGTLGFHARYDEENNSFQINTTTVGDAFEILANGTIRAIKGLEVFGPTGLTVHGNAVITGTLDVTGSVSFTSVNITGGSINGTTIGATVPSTGSFAGLTATGMTSVGDFQAGGDSEVQSLLVQGGFIVNGAAQFNADATFNSAFYVNGDAVFSGTVGFNNVTIDGGVINNTAILNCTIQFGSMSGVGIDSSPIGNGSPSTGKFTSLTAQGFTLNGNAVITGNLTSTGTTILNGPVTVNGTAATSQVGQFTITGTNAGMLNLGCSGAATNHKNWRLLSNDDFKIQVLNDALSTVLLTPISINAATGVVSLTSVAVTGGTLSGVTISASGIQSTPIGGVTPAYGRFTDLSSTVSSALQSPTFYNASNHQLSYMNEQWFTGVPNGHLQFIPGGGASCFHIEAYGNSGGLVLATGGGVFPVRIGVNRTTVATFTDTGLALTGTISATGFGAVNCASLTVTGGVTLSHLTTSPVTTTGINFLASCFQTLNVTGNLTFAGGSNLAAGRSATLRLKATVLSTLTFPAGWTFVGSGAPASIAAGKTAILSLTSFGTTDADVVAAYSVQP